MSNLYIPIVLRALGQHSVHSMKSFMRYSSFVKKYNEFSAKHLEKYLEFQFFFSWILKL